ncbi:MAG: hypothetical protein A2W08_02075 [Candidatus Rokubacteria bacterium RBG_16_73_20]|nr:MAG: hypothetical protein A2W08_02075 [Candidatus Rokubacteria bacterium RBG_16_73_20]HBH01703.1 hypothetical protein [Candidatus Rokubacteria bacterium]
MRLRVRDVMTRDPFTIDPDAPVATAMAVMRQKEIRHLPVVDGAGRLLGVLSDRDLRSAAVAPALAEHLSRGARRRLHGIGATLESLRVRDAMTWGVVTTVPEATLAHAAAVMLERRVGSLPVCEEGRLVAMLTERDVLKALLMEMPPVRGLDPDTFLW